MMDNDKCMIRFLKLWWECQCTHPSVHIRIYQERRIQSPVSADYILGICSSVYASVPWQFEWFPVLLVNCWCFIYHPLKFEWNIHRLLVYASYRLKISKFASLPVPAPGGPLKGRSVLSAEPSSVDWFRMQRSMVDKCERFRIKKLTTMAPKTLNKISLAFSLQTYGLQPTKMMVLRGQW